MYSPALPVQKKTDKIQKRQGDVTVGVAPSNDLAGDVTVGVAASADLTGDVLGLPLIVMSPPVWHPWRNVQNVRCCSATS